MKITYDKTAVGYETELWREDTQHRDSGGYNLIIEGLPLGAYVPKGTPLLVDAKKRTAKVLPRVKVVGGSGTELHAQKGAFVKVGDTLAGQKVTKVDTTNVAYDIITLAAAGTFSAGNVLAIGSDRPNRLSYATVKVEEGATIDAINAADEVEEDKLTLTKEDKESLTVRFLFV